MLARSFTSSLRAGLNPFYIPQSRSTRCWEPISVDFDSWLPSKHSWPSGPLFKLARFRALSEQGRMLPKFLLGAIFLALILAAPPPINKLALFPDKNAWCEAKNITQIVGHNGCESKSIQNRACLGQCFSYSVPNTFPQSTESLIHCDSCMPAQSQWEIVTLDCPSNEEIPRVDKLVEKILHCSCQACGKENSQEGTLFNIYPNPDETLPGEGPNPQPYGDSHHHHHHHHHHHQVDEGPGPQTRPDEENAD